MKGNPNVTDLSQLKWVFDGKKVPADFKSKMMEEIKKISKNDLSKNVLNKYNAESYEDLIEMIELNFGSIFMVK